MAYLSNKAGDGDLTPLERLLIAEIAELGDPLQYLRMDITGTGLEYATLPTSVGYQVPTGDVNGSNRIFIFTSAPNVITVDGLLLRKLQSDGVTENWTGTTTITLTVAPNFEVFGIA